jgi:hypothetical protein
MSMKYLLFSMALVGGVLPVSGCGGGHSAGVATGVDEPPQELSKDEAAAEKANERKLLKPK